MAIKKIKKTDKVAKRTDAENVPMAADIEKRREEFRQRVAQKTQPKVTQSSSQAPEPKSRLVTKRFAVIMTGVTVVLALMVAGAAYAIWNQSPEKIVLDTLMNTASAKDVSYNGSVMSASDTKPGLRFDGSVANGKSKISLAIDTPLPGELATVHGGAILAESDIYVRLDKASELLTQTIPASMHLSLDSMLPSLRQQVDGRWVRMTSHNLGSLGPATQIARCTADIRQLISVNGSFKGDLGSFYSRHPFLDIALIDDRDKTASVYSLRINGQQLKHFKQLLGDSKYNQSLASCDLKGAGGVVLDGATLQLTINTLNRSLVGMSFALGETSATQITAKLQSNTGASVEVPADAIDYKDVTSDIYKQFITTTLSQFN